MIDYVVHDMKMDADEFFPLFLTSSACGQIERGDKTIILGLSGIGLRSIQMYEQRRKNINRAAGETLRMLSRTLGCSVDDILEP